MPRFCGRDVFGFLFEGPDDYSTISNSVSPPVPFPIPVGITLFTNKRPCSSSDPLKFNVLYNSDMFFHERLYASLDVDLCRVRLHEPLTTIMQNPLLYVRDLVPKPCFEALAKLDKVSGPRGTKVPAIRLKCAAVGFDKQKPWRKLS